MSHKQCHTNNVIQTMSNKQCHTDNVAQIMLHKQYLRDKLHTNVTQTMLYKQCYTNNVTQTSIMCICDQNSEIDHPSYCLAPRVFTLEMKCKQDLLFLAANSIGITCLMSARLSLIFYICNSFCLRRL